MHASSPRVVVGVSGSLANLAALHVAVTQARIWQRTLLAVSAYPVSSPSEAAVDVLVQAFRDGFGEPPSDVEVALQVAAGEPGPTLVDAARRPGDLLVVGESRPGLHRLRRPSTSRYCRQHATQLIVVPRSPLLDELGQIPHIRDIAGLTAL